MRDTAGRAASDEHELRSDLPRHRQRTKAEKQRDAAAAVGLGKAVRASFVSTHCPLSFLLSSLPSLCSKQAEQGRPCVLQCNAFLLLEKGAGETRVCVSQHHIPLKRNQSSNQSSRQQDHQEGKAATAAAAKAAGGRKRRTSSGRTWAG